MPMELRQSTSKSIRKTVSIFQPKDRRRHVFRLETGTVSESCAPLFRIENRRNPVPAVITRGLGSLVTNTVTMNQNPPSWKRVGVPSPILPVLPYTQPATEAEHQIRPCRKILQTANFTIIPAMKFFVANDVPAVKQYRQPQRSRAPDSRCQALSKRTVRRRNAGQCERDA